MIEAVFFDAAGTLMKPVRRVGESYRVIAAKHGVDAPAAAIAERFRICFDAAPRLAFPGAAGEGLAALERNWWKQLVATVFQPWGKFKSFDDYFDELFAYFATPEAWALYPEVGETLTALKERGRILDVISNFDSRLPRILDGLGVGGSFEYIFTSSQVGYAKPDREIFDAALTQHGLKPADALHVGDSELNDLQGATRAGLKGVLIDRDSPRVPANRLRITNLRDLITLLDG
ncbi:MAG TPA: HAD-IA family hydrolase [Terriglobales bacterium]|jgi:putative hydrolase of the HAD superfamily|nr:HAD-IA family hydrolase [Terriglobales bacterium]